MESASTRESNFIKIHVQCSYFIKSRVDPNMCEICLQQLGNFASIKYERLGWITLSSGRTGGFIRKRSFSFDLSQKPGTATSSSSKVFPFSRVFKLSRNWIMSGLQDFIFRSNPGPPPVIHSCWDCFWGKYLEEQLRLKLGGKLNFTPFIPRHLCPRLKPSRILCF